MSIYKDCDIRGIYKEEFDEKDVYYIGQALGRRSKAKDITVCGDVRVSTPLLKSELIRGLKDAGAEVTDIGIAPTPIAYYAKKTYGLAIVTASHNPAKYNGIKLMLGEEPPTAQMIKEIEADVQELKIDQKIQAMAAGEGSCEPGSCDHVIDEVVSDYENKMLSLIGENALDGLKVVLDMGNGATCNIAPELYRKAGCEVVELFGEPDGTFPNRNPNPANFENITALCQKVIDEKADMGIAFDGDGDRAVFVDDMGRPVINEKVLIMLAKAAFNKADEAQAENQTITNAGVAQAENQADEDISQEKSVVYDQKCSGIVKNAITQMGGKAILERSGHAFIKKTFLKNHSLVAGEISGHFFFEELGHDDGMYAGLCMGKFLNASELSFSELADTIPTPFVSPDLRYPVPYERMDSVLKALKEYSEREGYSISTYDGVRAEYDGGWFLVRKSVTEQAMTVKIEADCEEKLEEVRKQLVKLIE